MLFFSPFMVIIVSITGKRTPFAPFSTLSADPK